MKFNKQDRQEYKNYLNFEISVAKNAAEKTENQKENLLLNHYVFNLHRDLSAM